MKNRKKLKGKVNQDPSNALIFINKYSADYQRGRVSARETEIKVLKLFFKFPFKEVMELLPIDLVNVLRVGSAHFELLNESMFTILGSFGPECEYDRYIQRRASPIKTVRAQLHFFFKKLDQKIQNKK